MVELPRPGVLKSAALALLLLAIAAPAGARDNRAPDLGDYPKLQVEEGNVLTFRAYAEGFQIYRWTGAGWAFVAPEAVLFDQDGEIVGTHYAGPTWESDSGSVVKGALVEPVVVNPTAIPWLLLRATSSEGRGIFRGVTFIQRLNTAGGRAPAYAGDFVGEEVWVPYAADYYFYRKAGN
jgi:hypothetical protein